MPSRILSWSIFAIVILVGTFAPVGISPALATPPPTHNIATCADLNALGADNSTRADTINLTADLDCTGVNFTPMYPNAFSGVFEGNGHSINHLTINQPSGNGIALISGADRATIQNLRLASGSITGNSSVGGLIGGGEEFNISNVTSNLSITASSVLVGGLIGSLNADRSGRTATIEDVAVTGPITQTGLSPGGYLGGIIGQLEVAADDNVIIRRTSYTGSITGTGGSRVGGLIGVAYVQGFNTAAVLTIEDSYTAGEVNTGDNEVGGLVGSAIVFGSQPSSTLNLNRSYSSSAVTGTAGVGGLFGIANLQHPGDFMTITDSFAVGAVSGSSDLGGLIGANSANSPTIITTTNDYYDGPGTGQTVCAALITPTGACTRIDTAVTPNYFKGNHASAPLNTWDFSTVWATHPGSYPTLIPPDDGDGIDKADELAAPNAGDANGDGVTDAAEANVASFPDTVSGHYAVLESSCGQLFNVEVGAESTAAGQTDVAYSYPGGLVRVVVIGCAPGATATITQYFYGLSDPTSYTMRKWQNSAYTTVPGAVFSAVTIGGQPALKAVYQITDGSALDDDGAVDGNIVDPAGPALLVVGIPNTGLGGPAGH